MATTAARAAAQTYLRDYAVDGVPASGDNEPVKSDGRAAFSALADAVDTLELGQAGAGLVFTDKAALDAALDYDANTKAEVYADSTPANNGVYKKVGASGAGSWSKVSDLAVTTLDERVSAMEPAIGNLLVDPFLKRLGYLAGSPTLGAWTGSDPANPYGGGSVTATSGVTRIYRFLPPGVRVGDTITVAQAVTSTTTATHTLQFFNASGATLGSPVVNEAGTSGLHTRYMTAEVPATAVGIRVDGSGMGVAKVFGLAVQLGEAHPSLTEAPIADLTVIPFAAVGQSFGIFGDSVIGDTVDVTTSPVTYVDTELSRLLNATFINFGVGGSTISTRSDDANYSALSIDSLIEAAYLASIGTSGAWDDADAAAVAIPAAAVNVAKLKATDFEEQYGVVIAAGVNDCFAVGPVVGGVPTGIPIADFRAAVRSIVSNLLKMNPSLQIVFQTPTYREIGIGGGTASASGTTLTVSAFSVSMSEIVPGLSVFMAGIRKRTLIVSGSAGTYTLDRDVGTLSSRAFALTDPTLNSDTITNLSGHKLIDYADAIVEEAGALGVPVIEAHRKYGLNGETVTERTDGGVHPSPLIGLYDLAKFMARGLSDLVR